jgi:hypothetical protein
MLNYLAAIWALQEMKNILEQLKSDVKATEELLRVRGFEVLHCISGLIDASAAMKHRKPRLA